MAGKGGARPGAGRKTKAFKALQGEIALAVLDGTTAINQWRAFLRSDDERVRLDTMKYLTDRAHGKAKQLVDVKGELELTIGRVVVNL